MKQLIGSIIIIAVVVGVFAVGQAGRNADRDEQKRTTAVSRTESRTTTPAQASQDDRSELKQESAATDGVPGASVSPMQQVGAPEPGNSAPSTATVDDLQVRDPEAEPVSPNPTPNASAATYQIDWSSIDVGGGPSSSPSYESNASSGESAVGESSSPTYTLQSGYWYGAFVLTACACDCHGNPNCDLVVNVFDVVSCVDEAFRGGPAVIDPNPNCRASSDNDVAPPGGCDGLVNVFDVVSMVDVAFRGGSTSQFCDPCL